MAMAAAMLCHTAAFAADTGRRNVDISSDAGAQMNQLQDYFQKERLASELQENKNKEESQVEQDKDEQSQGGSISFQDRKSVV